MMKKLFVLLLGIMSCLIVNAQATIWIWQNGESTTYEMVDSITFVESERLQEGALSGKFSVSSDLQVRFSKGNLQYHAKTNIWRFAENQYDIVGADNGYLSAKYNDWIDLFGWGTSGYNKKYPYMSSTYGTDYGDGTTNIADTDYDWGLFNPIANGGNKSGMWRTLTVSEWNYVLFNRPNAKILHSRATVNGVKGYMILPDDWEMSTETNFASQSKDFATNSYDLDQWKIMEKLGAVFFPCAGVRGGIGVDVVGSKGLYWSSTAKDKDGAYSLTIALDDVYTYPQNRCNGDCVRLVVNAD